MPALDFGNQIALPGDPEDDSHASRRKFVQDQVALKPSLGTGTPVAVAATASAGNATTAAPFNHVHNYTFYATAPADLGTTAVVGTATLPARGDHVHKFPTAAQVGAASTTDLTSHTSSTILHTPAVGASDNNKVLTAGAAGVAPTWQAAQTGVTLGTAVGTAVAATAANGTGTTAAKADHVHSYGFDTTVPAAVAATAAVGTATMPARCDHVHAYTFYATAPAALGTATVGTATLPARGDHVHALPTAAQVGAATSTDLTTHTGSTTLHVPAVTASDTNKVLTAGATGVAPTWQIAQTGVTLGTAVGTAVAATAANGTGTTAAKADHVHSYGFDTTVPAAVAATAAVGTATMPARCDHVHAYTFYATAPAALGTAAVGAATLPARGDHVHPMPSLAQLVSSTWRGIVTGDGTTASFPVTHNLNSQELEVLVWSNTTPPKRIYMDPTPTGANTLTLDFTVAPPATSSYIVRVVKWG